MSDSAHLYLSRLILDPTCRQVWSELAHPYEMHRTLMRAFSQRPADDVEARKQFGILFRADVDEPRGRVTVYVQSHVQPDWSFLDTVSDYLGTDVDPPNPACKDIVKTYARLRSGQVLSFRLRANPTKRIGKSAKGDEVLKGKRVGLVREEEQIQWLTRKGKGCGFEILMKQVEKENGETHQIPRVKVCREGKQRGRKREDGRSHEMTQLAVCFDGLLRITNADAFREALASGIGPAKAFGFGLLSIAPVRE
ncbi:MAG: type I-E CRISPR-associated protein Cas6/Cse3/CasE [Planctomycetes bacterium]|nr:type I-E CRISPR-associated protein Cas6/Cse3/CasE [Planctomycetota bacterium]